MVLSNQHNVIAIDILPQSQCVVTLIGEYNNSLKMQDFVMSLWSVIIEGGPAAIVAILFSTIVYLVWERIRLFRIIKRYQKLLDDNREQYGDSLVNIVDKYHTGNVEIIKALNEIKIVLATMNKSIF